MQNGISSRLRLAGVATVLMFAGQASAIVAPAASPITREAVAGISLSEWTARWWRWADEQRVAPYLDPDGRLCELGQEGPVWNLAGTNGRFQPRRQCVVPEGRHLLLPIINMASYQSFAAGGVVMFVSFFIPGGAAQGGGDAHHAIELLFANEVTPFAAQVQFILWGDHRLRGAVHAFLIEKQATDLMAAGQYGLSKAQGTA